MRSGQFALLLVGILFTLGGAFSFFPQFDHHKDVMQVDSGAVSTIEGADLQHLETRRSRGSRTSRKRPARPAKKRPARKKKTTKKKKASKKRPTKKRPTKKPTKKRPTKSKKGNHTKKPIASKTKSHTSAAACKFTPKPKAGTAGARGGKKLQARVDPDPCREQSENDKIMIQNYKIAAKAAKKKHETLQVNQMYLFLLKQGLHHSVVVGKVMKVGKELGMEATVQQLTKPRDSNGKAVRHDNAQVFCGSAVGGVCGTGPYRRVECGAMNGKYKFVSGVSVEFADPGHFIQKGQEVFMAQRPYNVLTWNCQIYAKKLINVTKLKPGQIVKLTDAQAQPSEPIPDSDSDDDYSGFVNGGLGGLRPINGAPLPFDQQSNNGDRMSIE